MLIDVNDAKTQLSKIPEQAHAGEEIILAKADKPYVRMMPLAPETSKRQRGRVKGINDDAFFDPLPDEEFATFGTHTRADAGAA